LRGLVGGGSTQVSVDAEIAEAEARLTIVHRGWVPRDTA
jgi:hypothetical protein